jgi:siroheme synthase-like protein
MENIPQSSGSEKNNLFPVFLKLEQLSVLVVGGGNIAHEKLRAILSNSPQTRVLLVAKSISEEIHELASHYSNINLQQKPYQSSDLDAADILIVAVNDLALCEIIKQDASARRILVNVADTPELCDFYLGSIVNKGNLKIAISTNGKSPTIAKRLKEVLNEMIPDEIDGVLNNMHHIRENMQSGFSEKVKQLDEITRILVAKEEPK